MFRPALEGSHSNTKANPGACVPCVFVCVCMNVLHVCVCLCVYECAPYVCVCVCEREREREREQSLSQKRGSYYYAVLLLFTVNKCDIMERLLNLCLVSQEADTTLRPFKEETHYM